MSNVKVIVIGKQIAIKIPKGLAHRRKYNVTHRENIPSGILSVYKKHIDKHSERPFSLTNAIVVPVHITESI